MPGKYAKKERASPESRSLLQTSINVSPEDNDPENNSFSAVTQEPDLQHLLEDDSETEELSRKRPRAWTNSPSSAFSRRPHRIRRLAARSAGICDACCKLMPKRRKGLRTFLLLGFSAILSLAVGCVLGVLMLAFFTDDVHRILTVWGTSGHAGHGLASWPTDFSRGINPIPCHSHNDYWRLVPLYSAIGAGCMSVEADIWLFEEELYVGHSVASLTRNRTLSSLYIEPLLEILSKQNPTTPFHDGRWSLNGVFDTTPELSLVLLIDFKTPGVDLWPYVLSALDPLRERRYLTHVDGDRIVQRPITVVGTGNTPFDLVSSRASNPNRDVFFDAPIRTMLEAKGDQKHASLPSDNSIRRGGRDANEASLVRSRSLTANPGSPDSQSSRENGVAQVQDLPSVSSAVAADLYNITNSYYASGCFTEIFGHLMDNKFSSQQMGLLRDQVRGAHRRGLKARYWELPYWPLSLRNYVWEVLVREGVDMLNVDDLKGATERDWRLPHPWW